MTLAVKVALNLNTTNQPAIGQRPEGLCHGTVSAVCVRACAKFDFKHL